MSQSVHNSNTLKTNYNLLNSHNSNFNDAVEEIQNYIFRNAQLLNNQHYPQTMQHVATHQKVASQHIHVAEIVFSQKINNAKKLSVGAVLELPPDQRNWDLVDLKEFVAFIKGLNSAYILRWKSIFFESNKDTYRLLLNHVYPPEFPTSLKYAIENGMLNWNQERYSRIERHHGCK